VASKVEADLLVILTDVDGLFTANPRLDKDARLIPVVDQVTPELELALCGTDKNTAGSQVGRGGMKTKLEAAKVATHSGCATIIANGKEPGIISKVFNGEEKGTVFYREQA